MFIPRKNYCQAHLDEWRKNLDVDDWFSFLDRPDRFHYLISRAEPVTFAGLKARDLNNKPFIAWADVTGLVGGEMWPNATVEELEACEEIVKLYKRWHYEFCGITYPDTHDIEESKKALDEYNLIVQKFSLVANQSGKS